MATDYELDQKQRKIFSTMMEKMEKIPPHEWKIKYMYDTITPSEWDAKDEEMQFTLCYQPEDFGNNEKTELFVTRKDKTISFKYVNEFEIGFKEIFDFGKKLIRYYQSQMEENSKNRRERDNDKFINTLENFLK